MDSLFIGIGNVGRQDDGLGWAFLEKLKSWGYPEQHIAYRYQLQVEDAVLICNYQNVIFVDAARNETSDCVFFNPCKPSVKHGFTSHELAPETIMYLAKELYDHEPTAHILGIQGYCWDLKHGLTQKASKNLKMALAFIRNRSFVKIPLSALIQT